MQEVVANCEDFCKVYGRLPYFYITGGDPILHPDFWKLMVLLKLKNIPFTLMGNPFHLDDEICQMEKYREYDNFVKCSKCELKPWCRGCPAVANGTGGSFYAADPQCWKTKNDITGEELLC